MSPLMEEAHIWFTFKVTGNAGGCPHVADTGGYPSKGR